MESIGDLLRQMKNSRFREQSNKLAAQLLSDPLVLELRSKHPELTDRELMTNLSKLYQYIGDRRHCDNCPGLDRCPNDFQGHYTNLVVQPSEEGTRLHERKTPCQKQLVRQHELQVRERIQSFYVDDRALNEGYNAVEIVSKDMERVPAVKQIFHYINQVKQNGLTAKGLYLVGHFGTGKTFLMSYMLHELAKVGYTGVIVYMPEFVEDLKSMLQDNNRLKQTIEIMKNTDLLVFDDIGAENLNPWVRDHVLGAILNYRMERKPTFYTSNYSMDALLQHLSFTNKDGEERYKGERLLNRIAPFVDVVSVSGENKRGGMDDMASK